MQPKTALFTTTRIKKQKTLHTLKTKKPPTESYFKPHTDKNKKQLPAPLLSKHKQTDTQRVYEYKYNMRIVVGRTGFGPATFCTSSRCPNQARRPAHTLAPSPTTPNYLGASFLDAYYFISQPLLNSYATISTEQF